MDNVPQTGNEPPHRPDHRARAARKMVREDRCGTGDDDKVKRMAQYITIRDGNDKNKKWSIDTLYSDLHRASQMEMGLDEKMRNHVQCGILSNTDPREIVRVVAGLSCDAVKAYEDYYFDIRSHLSDATFVIETVMPTLTPQYATVESGVEPTVYDLRKMVAYFGGWNNHLKFVSDPGGFSTEIRDIMRGIIEKNEMCKTVLASLKQEVSTENAPYILARQMDNQQEMQDQESGDDQVMKQLDELGEGLELRAAQEGELDQEAEYVEIA